MGKSGIKGVKKVAIMEQCMNGGTKKWYMVKKMGIVSVWIVLSIVMLTVKSRNCMKITFLDVGQGDAIVVQSETGHTYLIDGGSSSNNKIAEYQLIPYLKYNGIDTIECAFVSHLDEDHYNGILYLLQSGKREGIQVKQLILSAADIKDESYQEICAAANRNMTEVSYMKRGDYLQDEKLLIECLYPICDTTVSERNEASLALAVRYDTFLGVFMGDLGTEQEMVIMKQEVEEKEQEQETMMVKREAEEKEQEQETMMVKREAVGNVTCILLKAGHHGSRYSSSRAFLEWVKPDVTVISCGEDNSYGHPHDETLQRLENIDSEVLATPKHGAIIVEIGEKIEVRCWTNPD